MTICEFETSFKVDRYRTETWACTEEADGQSNYCIWHTPSEKKTVGELIEAQKAINGTDLRFPDFSGLNFAERDLSGWSFMYADFEEANLSGADLGGAMFDHSSFVGAKLEGADLTNARLNAADFENSNLRWADLRGAMVAFAYFGEADMRNIQYDEFQSCFVSGAVLSEGVNPDDLMNRRVTDLPHKAIETFPGPAVENYRRAAGGKAIRRTNFIYSVVLEVWKAVTTLISAHWIYERTKRKNNQESSESDMVSESQTELDEFSGDTERSEESP
ncbi:pentapeptide repeat-containing protein [Halalkaliarchaeum sp. AArc-GB]|uniref:pentapeptide repeat-containing protein n=1 Tax=Halalkaliarchaeum sp. AArc-GB TaxID=3074078 RepID=UPI00285E6D22|nr:pentapeptide repeat-containing protein [Halalkaliarchaeum sp. AArc-GB]MDR5673552.1 pentapeptide repeat-containing protein [Halalkaliarchaeum sp. AArc-GB]